MGITYRILFFNDDDTFKTISNKKYDELFSQSPNGSITEYVNKKLRYTMVSFETKNRKLMRIIKYQFGYHQFDDRGYIVMENESEIIRQAMGSIIGDNETIGNIIQAHDKFSHRRFEAMGKWEPSEQIKRAIFHHFFPDVNY